MTIWSHGMGQFIATVVWAPLFQRRQFPRRPVLPQSDSEPLLFQRDKFKFQRRPKIHKFRKIEQCVELQMLVAGMW